MLKLLAAMALLASTTIAQEARKPNFPTSEEIDLILKQAERAVEQYERSVNMEATLPSFKKDPSGLKQDRGTIEMTKKVIATLQKSPDSFHGLGGFLLFSGLDDASRNAALCGSSGMGDAATGLIDKTASIAAATGYLSVSQACTDASVQLYTVSESLHALIVREIEVNQYLMDSCVEILNKKTKK